VSRVTKDDGHALADGQVEPVTVSGMEVGSWGGSRCVQVEGGVTDTGDKQFC